MARHYLDTEDDLADYLDRFADEDEREREAADTAWKERFEKDTDQ
jgi:hypothetical protein